jgi:hypothetical protein
MGCDHLAAERISGNIYIRPNALTNAGDVTHGHKHNFDHTTIVFAGSIAVKATLPDGKVIERTFDAPGQESRRELATRIADLADAVKAHGISEGIREALESLLSIAPPRPPVLSRADAIGSFLVKAEVEHEITAREDGTIYWCTYSHRTPQGEIVETYTGWREAYS